MAAKKRAAPVVNPPADPTLTHVTISYADERAELDLGQWPALTHLVIDHANKLEQVTGWETSRVQSVRARGCRKWKTVDTAKAPCLRTLALDFQPTALSIPSTLHKLQVSLMHAALPSLPAGLRRLDLDYPGALDLSHLGELTHLKLGFVHQYNDLTPLAGLTGLKSLNVHGANWSLESLAGLSRAFNELELLIVEDAVELTSLGWKSCPPKLARLRIRRAKQLARLDGLEGGPLREVVLDGCHALGDLAPLADARDLEKLSVKSCKKLGDLVPIEGLTKLEVLHVGASGVATYEAIPDTLRGVTMPVSLRRRPKRVRAAKRAPKATKAKRPLVRKLRALIKADDDLTMMQGLELAVALDDTEARSALLGGVVAGSVPRVERWSTPRLEPRFLPDPAPVLVPNDVFEGGRATRRRRELALRWLVARAGSPALRRSVRALTLSGYQNRNKRFPVSLRYLERFECLEDLYVIHAADVIEDDALGSMKSLRRVFVEQTRRSRWLPRSAHLRELGIARCLSLHAAGFSELPALRSLTVQATHLDTLEPLQACPELESLTLVLWNILPTRPIASLPIRQLTIHASNTLRDTLPELRQLRALTLLRDHRLTTPTGLVETLATLGELEELRLRLPVQSLAPLAGHPELRTLEVRDQRFSKEDAKVLEDLPALERLDTKGSTFGGHRFSKRLRAIRR